MKIYYIKKHNFNILLSKLAKEYNVFVPKRINGDYRYKKITKEEVNGIVFPEYRLSDPLKGFLFRPIEKVAEYFNKEGEKKESVKKENIIFGSKACDLCALEFTDYIFLNQELFKDSIYKEIRDNTIIISSDCIDFKDVCFCTQIGNLPYPTEFFDINVSPVSGGYIVEINTKKGETLINRCLNYFSSVKKGTIEERNKKRQKVTEKLKKKYSIEENIPPPEELMDLVKNRPEAKVWEEKTKTCVECGGCNVVCPTCHCFYLSDTVRQKGYERFRIWDACQYKTFAKEAAGTNPRPKLKNRFRNRYVKKFQYFKEILDVYACTGCGRCIEVCIGKIDLREVLRKLKV